jgi:3-phenylpropionate/trans-cinnamate dioxygenase ferredoxin subunit
VTPKEPSEKPATAAPPGYERAAGLDEIPLGAMKPVRLGGLALVLCNVDGEIHAVEDNCSHQHYPLSRGELDEHMLTCDWHGACFDVRSGEVLALPAVMPIRTFQVHVDGNDVYVLTEGEAPTPAEALIQRDVL